jgi:prepilin-type N-terminal cleavage/methylation domain-containing protein
MKRPSTGFTLIEIMVTLLLSSVIIGAIGRFFIDSRSAFNKQHAMSYMVEDGRYVLDIFGKEFRRAGFLKNGYAAHTAATDIFLADPNPADALGVMNSGVNLARGAFIGGSFNPTAFDAAGHDINHFLIRYQLNDDDLEFNGGDWTLTNPLSPCTRSASLPDFAAGDNVVLTLYFHVSPDTSGDPTVLHCEAQLDNLTPARSWQTITAAEPLLSNVEKIYLAYGINTDNTSITAANEGEVEAANQYVRADQVQPLGVDRCFSNDLAVDCWTKVVSVRLYIVVRSEEQGIAKTTPSYAIEGQSFTPNKPEENRMYRVFSTTLASRNQ